jgi:hypothetical protein
VDGAVTVPLFEQVLGAGFGQLPAQLRALHFGGQRQRWCGQGEVVRGTHWLVAPCAWLARLPPSSSVPVSVEFTVDAKGERWSRQFGAARMHSTLWQRKGRLFEQLGALRFRFGLREERGRSCGGPSGPGLSDCYRCLHAGSRRCIAANAKTPGAMNFWSMFRCR